MGTIVSPGATRARILSPSDSLPGTFPLANFGKPDTAPFGPGTALNSAGEPEASALA